MSRPNFQHYRQLTQNFNRKVIDNFLTEDILYGAAKALGILAGEEIIFTSRHQSIVLMDFALHEYKVEGQTLFQMYREKREESEDKPIVEAYESAYTSLFKVICPSPEQNTLVLNDLFAPQNVVEITSPPLSQSAPPDTLLFFRLFTMPDMTIPSQSFFAFPGGKEDVLLKRYHKLCKKVDSPHQSYRRFVTFFSLNDVYGLDTEYH